MFLFVCLRGHTSNLILWGLHYPDTKAKQRQEIRLQASISDECRCKNPQQNTIKLSPQHIERIIHIDQVGLIPGIEWCFNIKNIYIYMIYCINRTKYKKSHGNIWQKLTPFMIKTFNKLEIKKLIQCHKNSIMINP